MRADFDRAANFVLDQEGGETSDTGGDTKYARLGWTLRRALQSIGPRLGRHK